MSFPQPRAGRRCDPDQEGKRSLSLLVSNAVFSKLIKLGLDGKKTPVAMAQELFEQAYAARCMGRGVDGSPADRLKPGEALADELAEALRQKLAESGRETARANIAAEEERQAHAATRAALAEIQRELDALRKPPVPVTVDPPEPGAGPDIVPLVAAAMAGARILAPPAAEPVPEGYEPCDRDSGEIIVDGQSYRRCPPPIGKGTVKAVLMMRSMNATPAEIADSLALRREIVDQVLRENRA